MKKRSKEKIKVFYAKLRDQWAEAKKKADVDEINAIIHGLNIGNVSPYSFYFVKLQMQEKGYDGNPYVDCQTYQRWLQSGYQVRGGETSQIDGIVWLRAETAGEAIEIENEEGKKSFCFPKVYHLFHRSQVEAIETEVEAQ